jgi:hypothetical protein
VRCSRGAAAQRAAPTTRRRRAPRSRSSRAPRGASATSSCLGRRARARRSRGSTERAGPPARKVKVRSPRPGGGAPSVLDEISRETDGCASARGRERMGGGSSGARCSACASCWTGTSATTMLGRRCCRADPRAHLPEPARSAKTRMATARRESRLLPDAPRHPVRSRRRVPSAGRSPTARARHPPGDRPGGILTAEVRARRYLARRARR